MLFYALRVGCEHCGASFLVGGGTASDLADWRRLSVECPECLAETPAKEGESVTLRPASPGEVVGENAPL
jgi:hypothetical protein